MQTDLAIPSLAEPLATPAGPMGIDSAATAAGEAVQSASRLDLFHSYIGVFVVAFLVTLLTTPLMRWLAIKNDIVDRPSDPRKIHRRPVAYLGGVAVFLGIMAGIFVSYLLPALGDWGKAFFGFHETRFLLPDAGLPHPVPLSIMLGLTIIMLLGLIDDVVGTIPRMKIAGMFVAAAALAAEDVGVRVAEGVLAPTLGRLLNNESLTWMIGLPFDVPLLGTSISIDLIYIAGTAVIAVFVLGACNASNLIDGLDGLLTGTTAIAGIGLLIVALSLAVVDDGPRDAQRIVLCMALVGACLGFLPHNFNPATIFLGDCGSLMLGYATIVIVLTLGDTGQTQLVIAGLIIYAIPIMDTVLAIIRRKLAGQSISAADDQHLHHMLRRWLGVKGAVLALYGIGFCFAAIGVAMTIWKARLTYALALIFASYIIVTAVKIARRAQLEAAVDKRHRPATLLPDEPTSSPAPESGEDTGDTPNELETV